MRKLATQKTSFRSAAVMATLRPAHLSCAGLRARTDAVDRSRMPASSCAGSRVCSRIFCVSYPAFLDCGLAHLRRPAIELREKLP